MSISCLMITTDRSERLKMLKAALESIEACSGNAKSWRCCFKEKVLSIDYLDSIPETGHALGPLEELISEYTDKGWIIIRGACTGYRGMVNNMKRGLEHITSDKLFYCEDHVIIKQIPHEDFIDSVFDADDVRWICYNTHIVEQNLLNIPNFVEKPDIGSNKMTYINDKRNYHATDEGVFLIKGTPLIDEYYLNFPAAITTTKIFNLILTVGCEHYHDIGIELGFTKAWFDCRLADKYEVAIYLSESILENCSVDFRNIHYHAQMKFRNNDTTMLHSSISEHGRIPENKASRNSFF